VQIGKGVKASDYMTACKAKNIKVQRHLLLPLLLTLCVQPVPVQAKKNLLAYFEGQVENVPVGAVMVRLCLTDP
jgi:hypothetical protein